MGCSEYWRHTIIDIGQYHDYIGDAKYIGVYREYTGECSVYRCFPCKINGD